MIMVVIVIITVLMIMGFIRIVIHFADVMVVRMSMVMSRFPFMRVGNPVLMDMLPIFMGMGLTAFMRMNSRIFFMMMVLMKIGIYLHGKKPRSSQDEQDIRGATPFKEPWSFSPSGEETDKDGKGEYLAHFDSQIKRKDTANKSVMSQWQLLKPGR